MDYGLIELNSVAKRCRERKTSQKKSKRTSANRGNANDNSNRTSSNANRPGPSNSRNGIVGQSEIKSRSSASLTKSISFETPYGIIRQSSSSTIEPERIHSASSQDSFKREISQYKMQPMPVLTENGDSSDEDSKTGATVRGGRHKYSKKGRTKGTKNRCEGNLEEIDLEHDDFEDVRLEIRDDVDVATETVTQEKSKKANLIEGFRKLFSCTGNKNKKSLDVDSIKLIAMEDGSGRAEK